ncbi:hypothetical protein RND81_09G010600 [Saponaria officinalis]|uniref:Uncharacterized protein n=1 Tax=Saponaria officinalis TaxID=3572 RepID=A0AAW1IFT0_SAPOF
MKYGNFSTHLNHHRQQPPPQNHRLPPLHHHQQPTNLPIHHQNQPHFSDYEKTLIDEVTYLHSLWHRGPPPPPQPPSHIHHHRHLQPTHTTQFKKKKNKTLKSSSDKEWPVAEANSAGDVPGPSGWPEFRGMNKPVSRPATAQEQARVVGVRIQLKGVESCSRLFEDDDEDEEEEDDDGDDEEEVDFFENLFEENGELRGFYETNCEGNNGGGEFICLVCGVIGNNVGRKYKNCVALVQHSRTVSKTKKKKAHRAYGNVVCKVLGWDVNRLPSIPNSVVGEEGEVKNQADKDTVVGEVGRNGVQRESIPDAREKDNITSTDVVSTSTEPTQVEGEVKKHNDDNSTAVEMEVDAANASQNQSKPEGTPDAIEKDNDASTVTQTEAEAKFMGDECKAKNHDSETDRVCSSSENAMSQPENEPGSNQEQAVKNVGEECSVPDSKQSEIESSLLGDDPYAQLPSLSGAFQIPE